MTAAINVARALQRAAPRQTWQVLVENQHCHIEEKHHMPEEGDVTVAAFFDPADQSFRPFWRMTDDSRDRTMHLNQIFKANASHYGRAGTSGGPRLQGRDLGVGGPDVFGKTFSRNQFPLVTGGPDMQSTLGAAPADRLLPLIITDDNIVWKRGPGDKTRVSGDTFLQNVKLTYTRGPIDFPPLTFNSPGIPFNTVVTHPDVNASAEFAAFYYRIEPVFQNGQVIAPSFTCRFIGTDVGMRPSNYAQFGAADGAHDFQWLDGTKPAHMIVMPGHVATQTVTTEPVIDVLENQFDRNGAFVAAQTHVWTTNWSTLPVGWRIIQYPLYLNTAEGQALAASFGLA